jgi:hypothetical protein
MKPHTYPMRPINGGPLERARPKSGSWAYEPKFNGWRALVNVRTGEMWNRKREPLSIEKEFLPVLKAIMETEWPHDIKWLDCEALERRHDLGRGSLILLDYVPESYDKTPYQKRMEIIAGCAALHGEFAPWNHRQEKPPIGKLLFCNPESDPQEAWAALQQLNKQWGVELFEGLVAKRTNAPYTTQARSASEESPFWVKHRWEF